jgi:cellulase
MKSAIYAVVAAFAATPVTSHATFQDLWVDGVDMGSQCIRLPNSNTPVTNLGGADMRCNAGGTKGIKARCAVKAGQHVTIEMHQVSFVHNLLYSLLKSPSRLT